MGARPEDLQGRVVAQTIGNQIAVLPDNNEFDGELINVFTLIRGTRNDQGPLAPTSPSSGRRTTARPGTSRRPSSTVSSVEW